MNRILSPLMTVLRIHLRNVRATRECSRTYPPYAELCMLGNKSLPLLQVFALLHRNLIYVFNSEDSDMCVKNKMVIIYADEQQS